MKALSKTSFLFLSVSTFILTVIQPAFASRGAAVAFGKLFEQYPPSYIFFNVVVPFIFFLFVASGISKNEGREPSADEISGLAFFLTIIYLIFRSCTGS